MALTKTTEEDKIEIVGPYRKVQVRTATVISEDGTEISRSFSRKVIAPGDDVSGESAYVQSIVSAVHTTEIVSAWQTYTGSATD